MDRNIVLKVICEKCYASRATKVYATYYFTEPKPTRYETAVVHLDEDVPPDYALSVLAEHLYDKLKETFTDEVIIEQLSTLHPPVPVRTFSPLGIKTGVMGGHSGSVHGRAPGASWSNELEQEWIKLSLAKAAMSGISSYVAGSSPVNAGLDDSGTGSGA
jgi:hypothetical protein